MAKNMSEKQSLKIAMLGHKRVPSREGGIEVVVEMLSTRMVKLRHTVICYNRHGHHISGKEFNIQKTNEYKGVILKNVFTIDSKGMSAMIASIISTIRVAFWKYDVAHFHGEGTCAMLWLPKLFGKRCIVTIHGLDHQRAKWGKFARNYIMLSEKIAVKFADDIIVLSKATQDYFQKKYKRKTKLVPNGVERPNIRQAKIIQSQLYLEKDSYILYLGRIVPEKGLRSLIEAFKQVKTEKKLIIAGSASDTDKYMCEIKELACRDKRIIFTGFVQGQLLDELYSNSYIYILPSNLEGMPLTLLEAMSYGNCCIVSDINECTEVIEDNAITFKCGNTEALRVVIQDMCDCPEKVEEYRKKSAEFICNKYNWDDVVNSTLNLYRGEKY